ncbi:hypothetical protein FE633_13215 [Streptomyces montanus]|uniref:Uncharacterized protein n=1 Tax=Streptomyces montanus TaxID=2580423 RepID=A0A5R9FQU9_9ACTN|nr:hypothetical protein [Streptomyces montanus]TLS45721.1 hypothetical protein FE633_13215 [Streptomyces montanus]
MAKTKRAIAAIAVEGLDVVLLFTAAGLGGLVGSYLPGLPSAVSGALTGAFGLALAFGAMELLDSFMGSLRALTRIPPSPSSSAYGLNTKEKEEDLPSNTEDLIDRLSEAARDGAAHQAALFSGKVDPAANLLNNRKLWVGIDGTSALFSLADGAYLHYWKNNGGDFPTHEYTFVLTDTEDEPVPVTSMTQVRDLLEQQVNRQPEVEPVGA